MTFTKKFSEFANVNLTDATNTLVGISEGANAKSSKIVTWTTSTRPSPPINGILGFNTTDELYEYYDSSLPGWVQIDTSGSITDARYILQIPDPSLNNAQSLSLLSTGILKSTTATGVVSIAAVDTDYYGPGMTGYMQAPAGIKDSSGNVIVDFHPIALAVNYLEILNAPASSFPALVVIGSDTNIGLTLNSKGTGSFIFSTEGSTNIIVYNTGTLSQHSTRFTFANTSATRDITWPDASGTVAFTSGASGIINPGTANQVPYYDGAGTTLSGVGPGSSGQIFQSAGSGSAPGYTTATYPAIATGNGTILRANGTNWIASTSTFADTYGASTLLYSNGANTVTGLATANSAALVTDGSGVPAWQAMSAGQILIGTTSGAPAAAAINSGTGIVVANGSGSITVNATGGGFATATIAGTTQTAVVSTKYFALNVAQTTVTLPAVYAVGDVVALIGSTANIGGWVLTAAAGDTIRVNNSTTSAGGTVTCTAVAGQCIEVVCDVANSSWIMTSTSSVLLTTA